MKEKYLLAGGCEPAHLAYRLETWVAIKGRAAADRLFRIGGQPDHTSCKALHPFCPTSSFPCNSDHFLDFLANFRSFELEHQGSCKVHKGESNCHIRLFVRYWRLLSQQLTGSHYPLRIQQLRTAAFHALGAGKAGSNPAIRLGLLVERTPLDPGFFELWTVLQDFQRLLANLNQILFWAIGDSTWTRLTENLEPDRFHLATAAWIHWLVHRLTPAYLTTLQSFPRTSCICTLRTRGISISQLPSLIGPTSGYQW